MALDPEKRKHLNTTPSRAKVKFEIYGEELIEKVVIANGSSGRVYLPPEWIGTKVKVVKC